MYAQDMMFGGPRVDTDLSQMEAKKVEIQFAIGNDDSSDEGQKAVVDDADIQEMKKEEKSGEGQKADQKKPTIRERSRSKEKETTTLTEAHVDRQGMGKATKVEEVSREEKIRLARERLKQRHSKGEVVIDGEAVSDKKGEYKA